MLDPSPNGHVAGLILPASGNFRRRLILLVAQDVRVSALFRLHYSAFQALYALRQAWAQHGAPCR